MLQKVLLGCGLTILTLCAGLVLLYRYLFVGPPHPPGYDSLMAAIDAEDPAAVEKVLSQGVNPNVFPNSDASKAVEDDIAPLDTAASEGNAAVVMVLLRHGADPNMGDGWNASPLCAAAGSPELERIKGCGNDTNCWAARPKGDVIESHSIETTKVLIRAGAKVNDGRDGSTALWRAAMDRNMGCVRILLDNGADPKTKSEDESLVDALVEQKGSPAIIAELRKRAGKAKEKVRRRD